MEIPVSRYNHTFLLFIIAAGILSFLFSLVLLQVFFGILAILWISEKNSEKKKAFDIFSVLILIFLCTRLLSVFLSIYPEVSYQSLYKDALFYSGFFSLGFYFKTFSEDEIKKVILFFVISFIAVALTGIIRFNAGVVKRAETFTSGYTAFSTYLAAGSAILMAYTKLFKGKKVLLLFFMLGIVYTGVVTSLGRFNILIALLLFISGLFLFRFNFKIVLLIITALALSYISFLNNSFEAEGRINQPVQLSDRDIIYQGAQMLWKERPLTGFGTRTFREIFPLHDKLGDKGVSSWHNDFLQIYFESGIFALAAFLAFVLTLFIKGAGFILRNKSENNYILKGLILALAGIILSSLVTGFINSPVLSIYFASLAALLSALVFRKSIKRENENGNSTT